jgi:methionyl-tRNA synthetase
MPESKDTDWDWEDFFHRNNDELVATWGNLANAYFLSPVNIGKIKFLIQVN